MNKSRTYARKLRSLALMLGLVAALAAVVASPAMATKFNASTIKLSATNLTVKKNGGEAKSCSLAATAGTASEIPGGFSVYTTIWPDFQTELQCTNGLKLWLPFEGTESRYNSTTKAYRLVLYAPSGGSYISPFSTFSRYQPRYGAREVTPGWTNGSALTPSTINFNETWLGKAEPGLTEDVTLTGTITATTSTGGLLTLSP